MEKLEIQSPAFATGAPIPKEYTQQGSDMSPPLEITNIPKGTQSLVLVCVDPDAFHLAKLRLSGAALLPSFRLDAHDFVQRRYQRCVGIAERLDIHNAALCFLRGGNGADFQLLRVPAQKFFSFLV